MHMTDELISQYWAMVRDQLNTPKDDPVDTGHVVSVSDLPPVREVDAPYTGDKYLDSFGETLLNEYDYEVLRKRSAQLFRENAYAKGIIRRLVTNIIHTGICLESTPQESIIGVEKNSLEEWSEDVETRFTLWGESPNVCDYQGQRTFGEIQELVKLDSIIDGDVLVVLHQNPDTKVTSVQLVSGSRVCDPTVGAAQSNNDITYGVEVDKKGRHIAYWVQNDDDVSSTRIPAYGIKSGRRIAWLVYGIGRRIQEVRGEPFLSVFLSFLKDLDRFRDNALRKAGINSSVAVFVERTQDKPGSRVISGGVAGASRRKSQTAHVVSSEEPRKFRAERVMPGLIVEELAPGETIKPHSTSGTDVNFSGFEEAILRTFAWAAEIPPVILYLAYSSNYSASQAEINEFRMFLLKETTNFGRQFCSRVYVDVLLSLVFNNTVSAPGLLDAWRDPAKYELFGAWTGNSWSGAIKPSADILKTVKAYEVMEAKGWITNDRISRELNGSKYTRNIKRLITERELRSELLIEETIDAGPVAGSNREDGEDETKNQSGENE